MDAERWQHVQSVFLAALDREPSARAAYVDQACADDTPLADEVRAMLAAHGDDQAMAIEGGWIEPSEPASRIGRRLGRYRLLRRLGQGGMGEVYLAERDDEQFHQEVAIKLLRPGWVDRELSTRFRTERQILARLVHPNIVPLLDGGVSEDGQPYLVMRVVDGAPLTEFCDRHRLPITERLALFRQICEAVRFAHSHLIVHRDLKPGNILVTAAGEVQLLDFGIAKLLDPAAIDVSVARTRLDLRVLTPEYAAPEQFRGEAISTATDIYALGVLLCELLTGEHPHRLDDRTPTEIERLVCERDPRPPSRIVGSGDRREQVASDRATTSERLRRRLRGDLDNIVTKALQREPSRRYVSVDALSEDVQRALDGRPIHARPDTVGYRVRKFVGRNRLAVASGSLIVLLVLGFGVAMAVQASRLAENARALAEERDRVHQEAAKTARVKTLVSDLFKVVDPNETRGQPADRLRDASLRIVDDLADQPEMQAELMDEVVTIYLNLGLHPEALDMARDSLKVRRATFDADHPEIARGVDRLAEALFRNSRFTEAEARFRDALALHRAQDSEAGVARCLVHLSWLARTARRFEPAEADARQALAIYRSIYGERHPDTANARFHLALTLAYSERPEDAETMLQEVLDVRRETLGDNHPEVAWTEVELARLLRWRQRFDEAESLLTQALARYRGRYGDDHPQVARTFNALGQLHEARGELDPAEAAYRHVLTSRRQRLGDDHTATASVRVALARIAHRRGAHRQAERLLLAALPVRLAKFGPKHRQTRVAVELLAEIYEGWGRPEQAEAVRRQFAEAGSEVDVSAGAIADRTR